MRDYQISKVVSQWAKELNIPENDLTYLINQLIKKNLCWDSLEKVWKYPSMGDNQKSCKMLDMMFHIEWRKGIVIFLPMKEG